MSTPTAEEFEVYCWMCEEPHGLMIREDDDEVIWVCTKCGAECLSSKGGNPGTHMRLIGFYDRTIEKPDG